MVCVCVSHTSVTWDTEAAEHKAMKPHSLSWGEGQMHAGDTTNEVLKHGTWHALNGT